MNYQYENSEQCLNFLEPQQYDYNNSQLFSTIKSLDDQRYGFGNVNMLQSYCFQKEQEKTGLGLDPVNFIDTISIAAIEISNFNLPTEKPSVQNIQAKQYPAQIRPLDFSLDILYRREKCIRGDRCETKNLGKYLRTETIKYLKMLAQIKLLSQEQLSAVKKFMTEKLRLENFDDLFKHQQIRLKCRQFFQSKYFVQNILRGGMSMSSKIILIKYIEKMRKTTYRKMNKWKD